MNSFKERYNLPEGYKVIWSNVSTSPELSATTSEAEIDFHHVKPNIEVPHRSAHDVYGKQELLLKKALAKHNAELLLYDHDTADVGQVNIEEVIMYFFVVLLIIFLLTQMVKCVRITLDPYNTVARGAWMETLEKRDSKVISSLGLRAAKD